MNVRRVTWERFALAARAGLFFVLSGSCLSIVSAARIVCAQESAVASSAAGQSPASAGQESRPLDSAQLTSYIDAKLAEAWSRAKVEPAPVSGDAEYLRRAHLDLVGKIPTVAELQSFMADTRADKRRKVVDDLLARGAHAQHFANTWRTLALAGAPDNVDVSGVTFQFDTWLRLRFAVNMAYDRLATEMLTAPLPEARRANPQPMRSSLPSPAAFFQANEFKREQIAAATSRLFLGLQLQCAQCHDHPFSHWTRKEFWSLAAFFDDPPGAMKRPEPGPADSKAIRIPETQLTVEPEFIGGHAPDWASGATKRELLARWITQTDNPYFARTAVNRMWEHFLGRGFVHPVDDFDPTNPPSHPELLDEMARQFALHHFDFNYLIRAITQTRAYQASSRASSAHDDDLVHFARMPLRRMTSDQLFASIVQATGFREERRTRERQPGALPDLASAAAEFRGRFADQTVARTEAETSILQALTLMNGKLVSNATDLENSETLAAVADAPFLSNAQRIEALFLATLSRNPSEQESKELGEYVDSGGAASDGRKALADVFWALLNSAEFALNH
jgi:hypothetical protein